MKRILLSALAAFALVSSAFAQDTTKQTTTGMVVTATNDALVIDTPTGRMTFALDSMLDRVRYNDLRPGTRVQVTHTMDAQNTGYVATEVTTLAEAPVTTTPPATNADDRYAASDQLPGTASPLAAVALLGLAALVGGWALAKKRKTPSTTRRTDS
jgi:hypothetical protein